MANNATVIAAHLDDKDLKNSIDKLVQYVDDGTKRMADTFNRRVQSMRDTLVNTLGNVKLDNLDKVGMGETGATRRTKALQAETGAVQKTAESYDALAQAKQRAVGNSTNKKGIDYIKLESDVDKNVTYLVNANRDVDAQMALIMQKEQSLLEAKQRETQETLALAEAQHRVTDAVSGTALGWGTVEEMQRRANANVRRGGVSNVIGGSAFQSYDDFRSAIASVLRLQREEVQMANESSDSYNRISNSLRQLRTAYYSLTSAERNSDQGRALVATMQEYEQTLRRIQAQAARPVNLQSVLGLREKTIYDIQEKMRQLAAYRSGLDVNRQKGEIQQVNSEYVRLQKTMNDLIGKNNSMISSNNALARSWNYMKNRLAFYFTIGASTQFVKNLIEIRSQYELNERALGILVNNAERGTEIFNQLNQMSLISPYTLIELSSAAKQLVAYDIAAKDVVDTTRRLADMAAAVGVPMERLTYALGQIKAYGYLNSRDNRMFANAGIPLVKQLADYYTELEGKIVSSAEVYDRIKKKAVDYNDVMQVIYKMTDEGGKFFDFQAKMAETLKVRIANLTLAWNNMLNEMGKETQGILTVGIGGLRQLFLHWRDIERMVSSVVVALGAVKAIQLVIALNAKNIAAAQALAAQQGMVFSRWMQVQGVLGMRLTNVIRGLGGSLKALFLNPMTWWAALATWITSIGFGIYGITQKTNEFRKSLREAGEENNKSIATFLGQYEKVRKAVEDTSNGDASVGFNKEEAIKAWEELRAQIELTSKSADDYIARLMAINDPKERVKKGFAVLDNIKEVNAALAENADMIRVSQDMSKWWNAWIAPDGLKENLEDVTSEIENLSQDFGSLANASEHASGNAKDGWEDYTRALQRMRKDVKLTADTVVNVLSLKGWLGDIEKINTMFSQVGSKVALDLQLSGQELLQFQMEWETKRSEVAQRALKARIEDEKRAMAIANDEESRARHAVVVSELNAELNAFDENNGRGKALWEAFTKWMKEQHISELRARFRDIEKDEIKNLDFSKGVWGEWSEETARKFAREHNLSINDTFMLLNNWVKKANSWSVFIPVALGDEQTKSVYEQLTEADSAMDTAYKKITRLKTRQQELNKLGGIYSADPKTAKEAANIVEEITAAEKDYAAAQAKGGQSKKENAAATRAQKNAESELQKALKEEISLIDKVRSTYKTLTKDGLNSTSALSEATSGYEETLRHINSVLRKYGVAEFKLSDYAGVSNPQEIKDALQAQLDTLKRTGAVKPAEIKDLEVKLKDLRIDAITFNQKTLTDSLNSELGKIKEEYELAVELDADPELGSIFLDTLGVSEEQLKELPRTAEDVARATQEAINKVFKDNNIDATFDLNEMLNRTKFNEWVEQNGHMMDDALVTQLKNYVDYVNKVRLDETKKTIQEWDKLLEKYAEYETKRRRILDESERELNIARKKNANDEIINAIKKRRDQELAQLDFTEFQKSPEWVAATGNIASMTNDALELLIGYLEKYKKTAKNLSPKQIKEINTALRNMRKELRGNNPFTLIKNAMDEASGRAEQFEDEIQEVGRKLGDALYASTIESATNGFVSDKTIKKVASLRKRFAELKQAQEEVAHISFKDVNSQIGSYLSVASQLGSTLSQIASEIGDDTMSKRAELINDVIGNFEAANNGAETYGGWWGAIIGGLTDLVPKIAKWAIRSQDITEKIEDSLFRVKELELAYKDLDAAVQKAYGTEIIGAQQLAIANKELQLEEIERQLTLEKSRKGKAKDKDRIIELEGQVKDLRNEINDAIDGITDKLLGSSVGDAAENWVGAMVDALRSGEDAIESFNGNVDDMVANVVKKFVVTKYLAPLLEDAWAQIEDITSARSMPISKELEKLKQEREEIKKLYEQNPSGSYILGETFETGKIKDLMDEYDRRILEAERAFVEASTIRESDVEQISAILERLKMESSPIASVLEALLGKLGLSGQGQSSNLSALQQGIQGITETTANALEAYMNGISQQAYLQSSLLTEIRDFLIPQDGDIQMDVQAQMLLQLQQSYQVQMSIQSILEGWNNASGQAVRVELVN